MSKLTLYHGSSEIIEKPVFGKGKIYNDYGRGFYCTEYEELAKEWACTESIDGYANKYEIETEGLKILNLMSPDYSILHWLALLMNNRKFRISTPAMKKGVEWIKEHFLINVEEYDIVMGYRADDSYFSFARAFVNNEISLKQLNRAMMLGELGMQIVLISPKAFERIKFISYEAADNTIYYGKRKMRDDNARNAYLEEMDIEDDEGIYIRDIIREEVKDNATCVR